VIDGFKEEISAFKMVLNRSANGQDDSQEGISGELLGPHMILGDHPFEYTLIGMTTKLDS